MKDIRLALTGFGNVGRGVAQLLEQSGLELEARYGLRLLVTGVADQGGAAVNPDGLEPGELLAAKRSHGSVGQGPRGVRGLAGPDFLDRAAAQVLLEAASTNFEDAEPGWGYVRAALDRRMDVVLASKGALVLHYGEVMEAAARAGCKVLFAGTVGAPLPVLELADRVLIGAQIEGFEGILNATTNHILTSMADGASYEEAVRRAQQIGIAETDPTLDVDAWDAAAKTLIVSNAILGADLRLEQVERQGIRDVAAADLRGAHSRGEAIKLIARARKVDGRVRATVKPERRPLADVLGRLRNDEMGIVFETRPLGRVAATVQQTGGIPTALTVLRDVINLARDRGWAQ